MPLWVAPARVTSLYGNRNLGYIYSLKILTAPVPSKYLVAWKIRTCTPKHLDNTQRQNWEKVLIISTHWLTSAPVRPLYPPAPPPKKNTQLLYTDTERLNRIILISAEKQPVSADCNNMVTNGKNTTNTKSGARLCQCEQLELSTSQRCRGLHRQSKGHHSCSRQQSADYPLKRRWKKVLNF